MRARPPTSNDVARHAGVSQTTVSLVFRENGVKRVAEETRQRVLDSARAIGYRPNHAARSLRQRRTNLVGMASTLRTSYSLVNIGAARRAALAAGRQLIILEADGPGAHQAALELVARGTVDALIISPPDRVTMDAAIATAGLGRSIVLAGPRTDARLPAVIVDLEAAGRMAVRHLVDLGHRRLAFVAPADSDGRRVGFLAGAQEAGIAGSCEVVTADDYTAAAGHRATLHLLDRDHGRPTAIFTYNEEMAIGALAAVSRRGLEVGADVSVVGCNDSPISEYLSPPLTSIVLPGDEVGRISVELAIGNIDAASPSVDTVVLPPRLLVRQSTAPPAVG